MNRTNLLLVLLLISSTLIMCKKDNHQDQEKYFATATINGNPTTFTAALGVTKSLTNSYLSYSISARKTATDGQLHIILLNYDKTQVKPGIYTGMNQIQMNAAYHFEGKDYYNLGGEGFTLEIKNVTTKSISGSFHGTLNLVTGFPGSVEITNGQFHLPIFE